MNGGSEPGDERPVEIEERTHAGARRPGRDLREGT
jgi:hypothetical protein